MITITLSCPKHPQYKALIRPMNCDICMAMFQARNEVHRVISVPPEERSEPREQCFKAVA